MALARNEMATILIGGVALMLVFGPASAAATSGGVQGQVQCPCECGKYLSVCSCSSAAEGRNFVESLQTQGYSDSEIAQRYAERYGASLVEYVPKEGSGLSLWMTPVAGAVVGAGALYYLISGRLGSDDPEGATVVCPECGSDLEELKDICPECGLAIHSHQDPFDRGDG